LYFAREKRLTGTILIKAVLAITDYNVALKTYERKTYFQEGAYGYL
jgi:hypothetical protein